MQSAIARERNNYTPNTCTIKFDKKDRTRGIGTLSRSKIVSNSVKGDRFVVRKEHIQLFRDKGINFTIIEQ
jgi:hypothetical protein